MVAVVDDGVGYGRVIDRLELALALQDDADIYLTRPDDGDELIEVFYDRVGGKVIEDEPDRDLKPAVRIPVRLLYERLELLSVEQVLILLYFVIELTE